MIVALYSSRPQCGKSTAATYLKDHHAFLPMPFADPLKKMLEVLLAEVGLMQAQAWDILRGNAKEQPIRQLGGITGRRLMQTLGTEWGRELDEDFWTGVMSAKLDTYSPTSRIVIDDMRFPNEYTLLKERGAVLVKIHRGQRQIPAPGKSHASEGSLDHHTFDYEIGNDGDIALLHAKLDSIMKTETHCRKFLYH